MGEEIRDNPIVDEMENRFLSFSLEGEVYAIEILYVTEIVGIQPITVVPKIPEYVKGIINLRGKVVPVIDLRLKFKKDPMEYNDRTCIVIVEIDDTSVGFIVDSVREVLTIDEEAISAPPDYKSGAQNKYLRGVGILGEDVVLILDIVKLISEEQNEFINEE